MCYLGQCAYIPVNRSLIPSSFVVMYADDILLIAPSVSELQRLFHACEFELSCLDMCILHMY